MNVEGKPPKESIDQTHRMSVHNLSFLILGFLGLLLQGVGSAMVTVSMSERRADETVLGIGVFLLVLGPIVLGAGSAIYAAGKNRTPFFGLLGLVSPLGLLFLAILQDRSGQSDSEITSTF